MSIRLVFPLLVIGMAGQSDAHAVNLKALVWCDHLDSNLLKPFAVANAVKVSVKEFPEFLKRTQPYPATDEAFDKKMQDLWTENLQAK